MSHRVTKNLRILGSLGVIVGQMALLFYSRKVGLSIMIFCALLSLPYSVKQGYYDIVLLITVGIVINVLGLIF